MLTHHTMWPLFFEHLISITWACSVTVVLAAYSLDMVMAIYHYLVATFIDSSVVLVDLENSQDIAGTLTTLLPEFSGIIIGTTCMLQMLLSMLLDSRYDQKLMRYYIWIIWYPLGFWIINMLTIIVAIPKTLYRKSGKRARWVSPDRGIGK